VTRHADERSEIGLTVAREIERDAAAGLGAAEAAQRRDNVPLGLASFAPGHRVPQRAQAAPFNRQLLRALRH
jgi:hypothetical protein